MTDEITETKDTNEIKEEMEVMVDNKENGIKDVSFFLNTGQSGRASYNTELINGKLCGVIISTTSPVKVRITLADYPEIVLFEMINLHGNNYIPLRTDAITNKGEHIRDSSSCWYLNDKLYFEIEGPFNVNAKFIVRYE